MLPAAVTEIIPVVAPCGTVATMVVALAEVTTADSPLKLTAFCPATGLNPVPRITTEVPTAPLDGENVDMVSGSVADVREIDRMLPFAS